MHKDHRFYTLIIASAASARFYRIIVHHRQIRAALIAGVTGLCVLMGISIWVFKQAGLLAHYHWVVRENRALKREHAATLRRLRARLATIEAESHRLRQMAEEIGLNVSGDSGTMEEMTSGVGGPGELDSFAQELDRVAARVQWLRESLDDERVRLATTPIGWPIYGRITSGYGTRRDPFGEGYEFHTGIDIGAGYGRPVNATADGIVVYAGYRGSYGKLVVVDHGQGMRTFYGHLSHIDVVVGDRVQRGDRIGRVGRTGRATASHVHYEIRFDDRPINPRRYIFARSILALINR